LEDLLPANLDFYRTPITTAPKRVSPSIPVSASISHAASVGKDAGKPGKTSIYGSVSTSDIAVNLKAILAEDEAGSRVVLSAEEISFVDEMDEHDRVKHLGVYEIEIKLEGGTESVRRTIRVSAQD
jgi:ribosomal protein L9